jgi:hypothetical protein
MRVSGPYVRLCKKDLFFRTTLLLVGASAVAADDNDTMHNVKL